MIEVRLNPPPAVAAAWPPRGPCGICGGGDARHRIFDALLGRYNGGDDLPVLAEEYGVTEETARELVEWWGKHPEACP